MIAPFQLCHEQDRHSPRSVVCTGLLVSVIACDCATASARACASRALSALALVLARAPKAPFETRARRRVDQAGQPLSGGMRRAAAMGRQWHRLLGRGWLRSTVSAAVAVCAFRDLSQTRRATQRAAALASLPCSGDQTESTPTMGPRSSVFAIDWVKEPFSSLESLPGAREPEQSTHSPGI